MAYPYSKSETIADAAVHATGLIMAVPGVALLMAYAAQTSSAALGATTLYAICLLVALTASAAYHMCPFDRLRPMLHRIDHAAIYFKIAGSYTPFAAVLDTTLAYTVLALVWVLACVGAVAKLSFWRTDAKGSLALYLGMGWLSALLIWPMWLHLSGAVVWLVVAGGLIYSVGTKVYAHPGMRYQNAIWHSFVLTASTCLFAAVAMSV
ncbi:MAG: hemolysin III family protein [Sulfitobacter sp.]